MGQEAITGETESPEYQNLQAERLPEKIQKISESDHFRRFFLKNQRLLN